MPVYFFNKANLFQELPQEADKTYEKNPNDWFYREVTGDALDRYNSNHELNRDYDYVFDGTVPEKTLAQAKREKLNTVNINYKNKIAEGYTFDGNTYDLSVNKKDDVANYDQVIQKDNKLKDADPDYERAIPAVKIKDKSGVQQTISLSDWDSFFIGYGKKFATLKITKSGYEELINSKESIEDLPDDNELTF